MGRRDVFFLTAIVAGGATLTAGLTRPAIPTQRPTPIASTSIDEEDPNDPRVVASRVDEALAADWSDMGLRPTPIAHELTLMRRLSLALTGSVPSLEDIRKFEARPAVDRLDSWLADLLADRRAADYLAERWTRVFVGTEDGPFLLFRRRRFRTWLSDQLFTNRPYDAIVKDLIAEPLRIHTSMSSRDIANRVAELLEETIRVLRIVMFAAGAGTIEALQNTPLVRDR